MSPVSWSGLPLVLPERNVVAVWFNATCAVCNRIARGMCLCWAPRRTAAQGGQAIKAVCIVRCCARLCRCASVPVHACVCVACLALPFKQMDNISSFLRVAKSLGVADTDCFAAAELNEGKNPMQVRSTPTLVRFWCLWC